MSCHLVVSRIDRDIIARLLAEVEAGWPTAPLAYEIDQDGSVRDVTARAQWMVDRLRRDRHALINNGNKEQLVSVSVADLRRPPPDGPLFQISLAVYRCDDEFYTRTFALLHALGPAVDAHRGNAATRWTGSRIVESYLGHLERPLPPAHPAVIGWINYWSADTCRLLGFAPDDPRRGLFARAETDAHHDGGGVTLQVTGDPLDLDRPDHRAALDALYDAFPQIPQQALRARRPRVTQ